MIIDVDPVRAPRSAPDRNVSLSELIKGVLYNQRHYFDDRGPEGRFGNTGFGSPNRSVVEVFGDPNSQLYNYYYY
jgi:hypothetical protein